MNLVPCPGCHGEGVHDFREEDEEWARTMPPALLERLAIEGRHPLGVVRCERCKGTGEVTDEEAAAVQKEARAFVARIAALVERRMEDEQRRMRL